MPHPSRRSCRLIFCIAILLFINMLARPNPEMLVVPTNAISDQEKSALYACLWDWRLCSNCEAGQICTGDVCISPKKRQLDMFWQFYRKKTRYMVVSSSPLRTHRDLITIIQVLKVNQRVPRSTLIKEYLHQLGQNNPPSVQSLCSVFELAAEILTMMECSDRQLIGEQCESSFRSIMWSNNESLQDFVESAILRRDPLPLDFSKLRAKDLRKAGLRFQGTENLRNHLKLDRRTGYVQIFHHTSLLKLYLLSTRGDQDVEPAAGPSQE